MDAIYIFGAHSRGRTLKEYIHTLYPDTEIRAFLVDNDEVNPETIDGIPVVHLSEEITDTTIPVYLAVRGSNHDQITEALQKKGFSEIISVTPEMDTELRNAYLQRYAVTTGIPYEKIDEIRIQHKPERKEDEARLTTSTPPKACIYVIQTSFDRPLKDAYQLQPYEHILQAGAALTDERITPDVLTDVTNISGNVRVDEKSSYMQSDCQRINTTNLPLHISDRNRQFCELTGLYWIWKHAPEEIAGLAHYRRHFLLPDDWVSRMEQNGVDVILPTPLFVAPSLEENYRMRHDEDALDCLYACLPYIAPADDGQVQSFFSQGLYSPCNMLIARKPVMDALCSWLFPILFHVADRIGEKEDAYQNRYPGFLSERLISYFFDRHADRYRVVYADKNFLP